MPEKDDRKYVRVYYNDLIRDYPDVWSDNDALATWLRMLATADPMWPTPPELPRSVKTRPLTTLTGCGLVARVGQDRFSLKGLDAERIKRQDAARNAAALRWHGKGIPTPDATAMPKRAEPSKDEPSTPPARPNDPWNDPEMEAVRWLAAHGCDIRPGNGYHRNLVTLVESHGVNAVIGMFDRLAAGGTKQGDTKGFVFGAKDALDARTRPDLRALEKDDRAEAESVRIRRAVERTKVSAHELGAHQEPNVGCPKCAA